MNKNTLKTIITAGPSQYMDCPSATLIFNFVACFGQSTPISLKQLGCTEETIPKVILDHLELDRIYHHCGELVADFGNALQQSTYGMPLQYQVGETIHHESYISISYFVGSAAKLALQRSFYFVQSLLGQSYRDHVQLQRNLEQAITEQKIFQPSQESLAMLMAARDLNVPIYEFYGVTKVLCYGQGENSLLMKASASSLDSSIGVEFQKNKVLTNILLQEMGYPTTVQKIAHSPEQAVEVSNSLGFPLAVKPIDLGLGSGVNSGIASNEELKAAFNFAKKYSRSGVLIEKHVNGYDHRITVSDGKVIGAIRRVPAMVTGDGVSSVEKLIKDENLRRPDEMKKLGLIKDIDIDEAVIGMLNKIGLTLESIPAKGMDVFLRSNGNISTGGTFNDVIADLHVDNSQMAIDIARYFRLNLIGLDFMTSDIAKPWSEEGAVIEVNYHPGLLQELADESLRTKFSERNTGRIPSVLLVDLNQEYQRSIKDAALAKESYTGFVGAESIFFDGGVRDLGESNVHRRCLPLLKDPLCKSIIVAVSYDELIHQGMPLDYFDSCYISSMARQELNENNLLRHLEKCCGAITIVELSS